MRQACLHSLLTIFSNGFHRPSVYFSLYSFSIILRHGFLSIHGYIWYMDHPGIVHDIVSYGIVVLFQYISCMSQCHFRFLISISTSTLFFVWDCVGLETPVKQGKWILMMVWVSLKWDYFNNYPSRAFFSQKLYWFILPSIQKDLIVFSRWELIIWCFPASIFNVLKEWSSPSLCSWRL